MLLAVKSLVNMTARNSMAQRAMSVSNASQVPTVRAFIEGAELRRRGAFAVKCHDADGFVGSGRPDAMVGAAHRKGVKTAKTVKTATPDSVADEGESNLLLPWLVFLKEAGHEVGASVGFAVGFAVAVGFAPPRSRLACDKCEWPAAPFSSRSALTSPSVTEVSTAASVKGLLTTEGMP